MARFKKRKWGSEKPDDVEKKQAPPSESDTPPTESESDTPPTESDPEETIEVDVGGKIEERDPKKESKPEESAEDKSATK